MACGLRTSTGCLNLPILACPSCRNQYENITSGEGMAPALRGIKRFLGIKPALPDDDLGLYNFRHQRKHVSPVAFTVAAAAAAACRGRLACDACPIRPRPAASLLQPLTAVVPPCVCLAVLQKQGWRMTRAQYLDLVAKARRNAQE